MEDLPLFDPDAQGPQDIPFSLEEISDAPLGASGPPSASAPKDGSGPSALRAPSPSTAIPHQASPDAVPPDAVTPLAWAALAAKSAVPDDAAQDDAGPSLDSDSLAIQGALDQALPPPPSQPERFGPSARALGQRRTLIRTLAVLLLACMAMVFTLPAPLDGQAWPWIQGLTGLALLALLWRVSTRAFKGLDAKEAVLSLHALELRRGDHRRLVVFESVRHIFVLQDPKGRFISLRLDLDDGSVTLRDFEGLDRMFAAAAQARAKGVHVEVEERRIDWAEPRPWTVMGVALGVLLVLAWVYAAAPDWVAGT